MPEICCQLGRGQDTPPSSAEYESLKSNKLHSTWYGRAEKVCTVPSDGYVPEDQAAAGAEPEEDWRVGFYKGRTEYMENEIQSFKDTDIDEFFWLGLYAAHLAFSVEFMGLDDAGILVTRRPASGGELLRPGNGMKEMRISGFG